MRISTDPAAAVRAARAGERAAKVPYPIGLRHLDVVRTEMLGSALARLTLGGAGIQGFQSHAEEEHVRMIFPDEQGELRLPEADGPMLRWPRPMPVSREYTVLRHDVEAGELVIDIALHEAGVGSDWARKAAVGDRVHVAGPPGGLVVPDRYRRYVLAGDITALPQIARRLQGLPPDATGHAIIEVTDAAEQIPLDGPAGVEVRWLHRGSIPPGTGDALAQAVQELDPAPGAPIFVWIAGEAGAIKPLRRWVREHPALDPGDARIVGYWKRGVADFDDD